MLQLPDATIRRPGRALTSLTALFALVAVMLPSAPAAADDTAEVSFRIIDDVTTDEIEGAEVTLDGRTEITDADGETNFFTVDAEVEYDTVIDADGYEERTVTGSWEAGTYGPITFRVNPGPSFEITGVTAVPGDGEVTVSWDALPEHDDLTGYRVGWGPGSQFTDDTYTEITATGLENGEEYDFAVRARTDADWDTPETIVSATPQADPAGDVIVNVTADDTGDVIEGADVNIDGDGVDVTEATDSNGTAEFLDVPVGEHTLRITGVDGYLTMVTAIDVEVGDNSRDQPVFPESYEPRDFEVEGDAGEAHATWTHPTAGQPGQYDLRWETTDNAGDGTWSMVELDGNTTEHTIDEYLTADEEHTFEIRADYGGGDTSDWVATTATPLEAEDTTGDILINVTDLADQSNIDGAAIFLDGDQVATHQGHSTRIEDLEPDTYDVRVEADGYEQLDTRAVEVEAGETTHISFAHEAIEEEQAELTVEVRDDAGDLLDDASASLDGGPFIGPGDGTFFTNLDAGTYEIEVSADGYESDSRTVDADWGDVIVEAFALDAVDDEPESGTLEGTVTDADTGDPIEGAVVTIDGQSDTTGADGAYTIEGVDAGTYEIEVSADGYADDTAAGIEIDAGESHTHDVGLDAEPDGLERACPEDVPESGFVDVVAYTDEIDCIVWWDIMEGTHTGDQGRHFSPEDAVTRAQVASAIARTITETGGTLPSAPSGTFSDVGGGGAHGHSIEQLAAADVIHGYPDGTYRPNETVTRAQVATLLTRAYEHRTGEALADTSTQFPDATTGPHRQSIGQMADQGWAQGYSDGAYRPSHDVRRDHLALMLRRMLGTLVDEHDVVRD